MRPSPSRFVAWSILVTLVACAPGADPDVEVATPSPTSEVPTPEPAPPPGTGVLLRPAELDDDPVWCWTFIWQDGEDVLTAIGTTTETWVPVLTVDALESGVEDSAVHDDAFVLVGGSTARRVDLVTGEVLVSEVDLLAVRGITTWNDALITMRNLDELAVFSDFESMVTGDGTFPTWEAEANISRFDLDGELLYGAWHSAPGVYEIDPATGLTLRQIRLEGFNGWFLGLSVEAGVIHVLTHRADAPGHILRRFDLEGNALPNVLLPGSAAALFCDSLPTEGTP